MKTKETKMIEALRKIAYPISYLQEEATKIGAKLEGQAAVQLSKDPQWLRSIAEDCLKEIGEGKN
jgi:hypothetical protein